MIKVSFEFKSSICSFILSISGESSGGGAIVMVEGSV